MPIDIHAHFVPPEVITELRAHATAFPDIGLTATPGNDAVSLAFPGEPPTRPIAPGLLDLGKRRAWMAEQGITRQCLAGWVDLFGYGLPLQQGADWCRLFNDGLAAAIGADQRFTGVAALPLQDATAAAAELSRVVSELHFPSVMTTTRIAGVELDDPALDPFWATAEEAQAVVLIHPGFAGSEERLGAYGLANAVGRASETTLAITRMIFGGVFERHPRLVVVSVHGGGFLPYQLGRLQRAYEVGTFEKSRQRDPRTVIRQLYYDSVVFQPQALRFLIDQVGVGQVMLGSDYPFPIGDLSPLQVVYAAKLAAEATEAILDRTAARLLERAGRHIG